MQDTNYCPVKGLDECGLPESVWVVRNLEGAYRTIERDSKKFLCCFTKARIACRFLARDLDNPCVLSGAVVKRTLARCRLLKYDGLALYDLGTVRYLD